VGYPAARLPGDAASACPRPQLDPSRAWRERFAPTPLAHLICWVQVAYGGRAPLAPAKVLRVCTRTGRAAIMEHEAVTAAIVMRMGVVG
jgi:hypothetical protein